MQQLSAGVVLAGRFHLVRLLGRGGTAEVWEARDLHLKADVAVRVVATPDPAQAARLEAAWRSELPRLARLVHPGILRPTVVLTDGSLVCLGMDLADGGVLGSLRGAGYREVLKAVREVVEALQYAHAHGVIHGDLKAGNVLRDRQGHWRITDFPGPAADGEAPSMSLSATSPQRLAGGAPTAADDIYAVGALVYDLLAGHPPLHPGITPARIRDEVPAGIEVDGEGSALPAALRQWLAALLEKDPGRRPGSLGPVRTRLTELLDEEAPRRMPPPELARAPVTPAPRSAASGRAGGIRPGAVFAGLALALLGLVAVLVWLPRVISERGPLLTRSAEPPPPLPPDPVAAPPVDLRAAADTARAGQREAESVAKAARADRWSGADWLEGRRIASLADDRYAAGDFSAAASSYGESAARFRAVVAGAEPARARAVSEGEAALRSANRVAAEAAFARALLIAPEDQAAQRGLVRSRNLVRVLALMAEGEAREAAGDVAAARRSFAEALKVDGDWPPARESLAKLDARLAQGEFERAMARGLAALAAGRSGDARAEFGQAAQIRPGDPEVRRALEQIDGEDRRVRLLGLQADAEAFVAAEKWAQAKIAWEALLAVDPDLAVARDALAIAQSRAALDARLEQQLANEDRMNDAAIAGQAKAAITDAIGVATPGPRLRAQVARLEAILARAEQPVAVQFVSDNLTNVTIYKVGALGAFASRSVELRPGTYVVVGSRDGYRDVRRNLRVMPEGNAPVSVRCEEPI